MGALIKKNVRGQNATDFSLQEHKFDFTKKLYILNIYVQNVRSDFERPCILRLKLCCFYRAALWSGGRNFSHFRAHFTHLFTETMNGNINLLNTKWFLDNLLSRFWNFLMKILMIKSFQLTYIFNLFRHNFWPIFCQNVFWLSSLC